MKSMKTLKNYSRYFSLHALPLLQGSFAIWEFPIPRSARTLQMLQAVSESPIDAYHKLPVLGQEFSRPVRQSWPENTPAANKAGIAFV